MILFSVIYEFDTCEAVRYAQPPKHRKWHCTEGDEERGYGYLGGDWAKARHRKYAALLTREEFEEFVRECEVKAEDTETMGSVGAPGFGFGWAPAISFRVDKHDTIGGAYVTPMVAKKGPDGKYIPVKPNASDRDWERLRDRVIAKYN